MNKKFLFFKSKQDSDEENFQNRLELFSHLMHEVRNPLNVILGYSQLGMEPDQSPEVQELCFRTVYRNGQILLKLANEFLDYAKASENKLTTERVNTNLVDCFEDLVDLFQIEAKGKPLIFKISSDGAVPKNISTDTSRFRQVMVNLISNAIKFTKEGTIEVRLRFLDPKNGKKCLQIDVHDTGIGMSAVQQHNLFQAFSQADPSTYRKYGGSGLGLCLSQKLAKAIGGDLFLKSSVVDKGSIFRFCLYEFSYPPDTEFIDLNLEWPPEGLSERDRKQINDYRPSIH